MDSDDLLIFGGVAVGLYLLYKLPAVSRAVNTALTPYGLGTAASTQERAKQRADSVTSKIPSDAGKNVLFITQGNTTYRITPQDVETMAPFQRLLYGAGVPISDVAAESGWNLLNPIQTLKTAWDSILG